MDRYTKSKFLIIQKTIKEREYKKNGVMGDVDQLWLLMAFETQYTYIWIRRV